jgi:tRNA(Ser,Leu) C12 N-acetylase TAN1
MRERVMHDWNVIVTINGDCFKAACDQLAPLGRVDHTRYYNVLAVKVDDIATFMETLCNVMSAFPDTRNSIARVAPVRESFTFQTAEEFASKARESLAKFAPQLSGRRFHVRVHRRGWKEKLHRHDEEQSLGGFLIEELERSGTPAKVAFDDPDYIADVEILDNRAGVALWSRDDLRRYRCLNLD